MRLQKVTKRKGGIISICYEDDKGRDCCLILDPEQIIAGYEAMRQIQAGAQGNAGLCETVQAIVKERDDLRAQLAQAEATVRLFRNII